jgi:cytochrome c-type biogenesis protein CcmH/NrfG
MLYADLGRLEESATAFENAVRVRPDAAASVGLGLTYFEMERYPEAIGAFRESLRLDPLEAEDVHYYLAFACTVVGDSQAARNQWRILSFLGDRLTEELQVLQFYS